MCFVVDIKCLFLNKISPYRYAYDRYFTTRCVKNVVDKSFDTSKNVVDKSFQAIGPKFQNFEASNFSKTFFFETPLGCFGIGAGACGRSKVTPIIPRTPPPMNTPLHCRL